MGPHTKTRIAWIAGLLLSCAVANGGDRIALLIGNDDYATSPLSSCVNDARAMSAWLQSVGYQPSDIDLLTNADRAAMVAALRRLEQRCIASPAGQVVFFYSGHGMVLDDDDRDEGPDDRMDEAYVGSFRQRVESVDEVVLRDDEFYAFMSSVRRNSRQTVIIVDSCFAGGAAKSIGKCEVKSLTAADVLTEGTPSAQKSVDSIRGVLEDREMKSIADASNDRAPMLVVTAVNQYQEAQAGHPPDEPLSKFTAAFLKITADGAGQSVLSMRQLQDTLTDALYGVPQSPVVIAAGFGPDARFMPDIFGLAEECKANRQFADLLFRLLTAPRDADAAGDLDVRCTSNEPVPAGRRFALNVTTKRSGYVSVASVEASGRVRIQFPNRYRLDNSIEANKPTMIPYRDAFEARRPAGRETFFVILTQENPFRNFNFAKCDGSMVVGQIQDVLRWYPELATTPGFAQTGETLTRGINVRPVTESPTAVVRVCHVRTTD